MARTVKEWAALLEGDDDGRQAGERERAAARRRAAGLPRGAPPQAMDRRTVGAVARPLVVR